MKRVFKIIVATLFTLLVLEGISTLALKRFYPNAGEKPIFNRELSGYTVFRNTPNFTYYTYKTKPDQQDIRTDDYGFISNEPVTIEKDSNTIRIFLMGGSAMMSAGQNDNGNCYPAVRAFTRDIYSWNISIAGLLQTYLQQKFPSKKIQVVNAAVYSLRLHQSMLLYLETVIRFKPDLIIDMDGFNDVGSIYTGYTYQLAEMLYLKNYLNLASQHDHAIYKLKTAQVILYAMAKYFDHHPQSDCGFFLDTTVYNRAKYFSIKGYLEHSSETFTHQLKQYMNVLRGDSVKFLFVLQPMLSRETNKHLAGYESRMCHEVAGLNPRGTDKWKDNDDPKVDFSNVNSLHLSSGGGEYLTERFFFDDYLSDKLKQEVEAAGFVYTDINKDITQIDSSVEFYTDYCHLTEAGYQIVAKRMGDLIMEKKLLGN